MARQQKIQLPISLIILDGIGAILVAIALAEMFGEFDIIPDALKFNNYQIIMIITGVLLMIPFIIHVINIVKGNTSREV